MTEQQEIRIKSRRALALWKQVVKLEAGGKCEGRFFSECTENVRLNAHHIEAYRKNKALRFDVHNGMALCQGHHTWGKFSAQQSFCFMYSIMTGPRIKDLKYLQDHYNDQFELTIDFLDQKIVELERIEELLFSRAILNCRCAIEKEFKLQRRSLL